MMRRLAKHAGGPSLVAGRRGNRNEACTKAGPGEEIPGLTCQVDSFEELLDLEAILCPAP